MANEPINKALYNRVKSEAKRKFDRWPSAYGSAWLVKEYKRRGGKYKQDGGGMSQDALKSMKSFYEDFQSNKFDADAFKKTANNLYDLGLKNEGTKTSYLKSVKGPGLFGTGLFGKNYYKEPGLFSKDTYYTDVNVQKGLDQKGNPYYVPFDEYNNENLIEPINDLPEFPEMAQGGGIPERYRNMGFNKVGAKKQSNRPGKKWMVLAKKGDKYKVVHGGYKGMKDFTQHGNPKRRERFWDRMGGRDSAKAKDPFSPLYWHKRFGTWQEGGQYNYDINNPIPQFEMGNSILSKMQNEAMRKGYLKQGGAPCYECGGSYAKGGTNNPGFKALPAYVQQKIKSNMQTGGMTPFNANPDYYNERLRNFIDLVNGTASDSLFSEMEQEGMMPQARYGMPIFQDGSEANARRLMESAGKRELSIEEEAEKARIKGKIPESEGGTKKTLGKYTAYPNERGDYIVSFGNTVVAIVPGNQADKQLKLFNAAPAPKFDDAGQPIIQGVTNVEVEKDSKGRTGMGTYVITVPNNELDQSIFTGESPGFGTRLEQSINMLQSPFGIGSQQSAPATPYETYINTNYGTGSARQDYNNQAGLIGGFLMPGSTRSIGLLDDVAGATGSVMRPGVNIAGRVGAGEQAAGALGTGSPLAITGPRIGLNPGATGRSANLIQTGKGSRLGPGRVIRTQDNIGRTSLRQGQLPAVVNQGNTSLAIRPTGNRLPAVINAGANAGVNAGVRTGTGINLGNFGVNAAQIGPGLVSGIGNILDNEYYNATPLYANSATAVRNYVDNVNQGRSYPNPNSPILTDDEYRQIYGEEPVSGAVSGAGSGTGSGAGARSTRPTVRQQFEEINGPGSWQKAKDAGLTDGSAEANTELLKRAKAGEDVFADVDETEETTVPETTDETVEGEVETKAEGEAETTPGTSGTTDQTGLQQAPEFANISSWTNFGNEPVMYSDPETGMVMNVPQEMLNQGAGQMYGQQFPVYLKKFRQGPFGTVAKFRPYPTAGGSGNLFDRIANVFSPNQGGPQVPPNMMEGDEDIISQLQEQKLLRPRDVRKMRRQESREMRRDQRGNLREMRNAANDIIKGSNMQKRGEMFDARMDMRDERFNDRMDRRANRINERFDRRIERNQDQLERFQDRMQRKEERRNRKAEYGGMSNPYLYMYKEGGEYYMDENTINMILAMGGNIEFID